MLSTAVPAIYGIIGYPLGHSLSPLLHSESFRLLGLPAVLAAWPAPPAQLPELVSAMRLLNVRGCCVTIPHKEAVIPLLDAVSDRVRLIGAANTVYRDGERFCGENTDILGFLEPLQAAGLGPQTSALILGAGGTARAAAAGLRSMGLRKITVSSRRIEQASALAAELGLSAAGWESRAETDTGLIVNTTSLGMKGLHENETPFAQEWLTGRAAGIVYDVVYTPFRTRLLREAEAAGWQTIGGLEMFFGQADHQCRLWTGQKLPAGARTLAEKVLAAREG